MSISEQLRKPYVYLILVVIVVITSVFSFSYKYKNQIAARLIKQVGQQTGLIINVEASAISIFKTFPDVQLELQNMSVVKASSLDSLAFVRKVAVSFDLEELRMGNYKVKYLGLEGGYVHMLTEQSGKENYKIKAPQETKADTSRWQFDLDEIRLTNTNVKFIDATANRRYIGKARDIRCKLTYDQQIVKLALDGNFLLDEVTLGNTTFLYDKSVTVRSRLLYDTPLKLLAINNSKVVIESTEILLDGTFNFSNKQMLDLRITANETSLKNLSALAPGSMYDHWERYAANGQVSFLADIQGYTASGEKPNIYMEFGCRNTSVRRIGTPYQLDSLNFFATYLNNKSDSAKNGYLSIKNLQLACEKRQVTGMVQVKDFEDPVLSVGLHGEMGLTTLMGFLDVPNFQVVRGKMKLDVAVNGHWEQLLQEAKVGASREKSALAMFQLEDFQFLVKDSTRTYRLPKAEISFSPWILSLELIDANVGNSDLFFQASFENWGGWFSKAYSLTPVTYRLKASSTKWESNDFFSNAPMVTLHDVLLSGSGKLPTRYFEVEALMEQASFNAQRLTFTLPKKNQKIQGRFAMNLQDGDLEKTALSIFGDQSGSAKVLASIKGLSRWYDNESAHCQVDIDVDAANFDFASYLMDDSETPVIKKLHIDGRVSTPLQAFFERDSTFFKGIQSSQVDFSLANNTSEISQLKGELRFIGDGLKINSLDGKIGDNKFHLMGEVQQYYSLFTDKDYPKPELTLFYRARKLDLKNLLSSLEKLNSFNDSTLKPWGKLMVDCRHLDAEVESVKYNKMLFKNFKASGSLWNMNTLLLDTARAIFSGGIMGLNGRFQLTDRMLLFHSRVENVNLATIFDMVGENNASILPMRKASGFTDATSKAKLYFDENWQLHWQNSHFQSAFHINNGSLTDMTPLMAITEMTGSTALETPTKFRALSGNVVIDSGDVFYPVFDLETRQGDLFLAGYQINRDSIGYRIELPLAMMDYLPYTVWQTMPSNMVQFMKTSEVMALNNGVNNPGNERLFIDHQQYGEVNVYLKYQKHKGKHQLLYDRQEAAGKIRLLPNALAQYLPQVAGL